MENATEIKESMENKILGITSEMVVQDKLTDEEAGVINQHAQDGEYEEALDLIEQYEEADKEEEFQDEEVEKFSEAFGEALDEAEKSIEEMKEEINSLRGGVNRQDMIQYLRGEKSSRTKAEVEDLFDAMDDITSTGVSTNKLAKVLSRFSSELNVSQTEEMIERMREKR